MKRRAYRIATASFLGIACAISIAQAQVVVPAAVCPEPSLDVDEDGTLDAFIEESESRGTGGATYEIRLSHRGRARSAGSIEACTLRLGPSSSHGARDLIAVWRLGAEEARESYLRFDGTRYRVVRTRDCDDASCAR